MFLDNLLNASRGVSKLRAFLGLLLSNVSTVLISLEVMPKKPHVSHSENSKGFLEETLRNVRASSEMHEKLEKAKKLFQNEYKSAKKSFKKLLSLKLLEKEKTTIELYLATIYLLQEDIYKAERYLKGKALPFVREQGACLTQIMSCHVHHLIKKEKEPQTIKEPFLAIVLYEKAEDFSEDEKIMAKALSQKFNIN